MRFRTIATKAGTISVVDYGETIESPAHELRFSLYYEPNQHRIAVMVWRDGKESSLEYKEFSTKRGKNRAENLAKEYVVGILHHEVMIKKGK